MYPIMHCLLNGLMIMLCQLRTFMSEDGIHNRNLYRNQCVRETYKVTLVSTKL